MSPRTAPASADVRIECRNANLAEPKDGTDGKDRRAADPLVVDIGAVGRVEVGDQQLVIGEADDAMFARDRPVREDHVGGRGRGRTSGSTNQRQSAHRELALLSSRQWTSDGSGASSTPAATAARGGTGRRRSPARCQDEAADVSRSVPAGITSGRRWRGSKLPSVGMSQPHQDPRRTMRQRGSERSPFQSESSAVWVSSKTIGRSHGLDDHRDELVAAVGERRLRADPARRDRARRPQDHHRLGVPQPLLDDLVERLARMERGVPPHLEALFGQAFGKARAVVRSVAHRTGRCQFRTSSSPRQPYGKDKSHTRAMLCRLPRGARAHLSPRTHAPIHGQFSIN